MAKKSKSKSKSKKSSGEVVMVRNKNVDIEKISNGFVVSTFTEKGRKSKFGKTKKEAQEIALKMLT